MSDYDGSSQSPMEHGELDPSPRRFINDVEEDPITIDDSSPEKIEDALNIQPPPAGHTSRKDKKHKRHRDNERHRAGVIMEAGGRYHDDHRGENHRGANKRDAREVIRERERERRMRDEDREAKRREQSRMESVFRERLERLERETHKERYSQQHDDQSTRHKQKQDERKRRVENWRATHEPAPKRERFDVDGGESSQRRRSASPRHQAAPHSNGRDRKRRHRRSPAGPKTPPSPKSEVKLPQTPPGEPIEHHSDDEHEEEEKENVYVDDRHSDSASEADDASEASEEGSGTSSEDSDSDSESESGSSSAGSAEGNTDQKQAHKVKSKFDDQSENESLHEGEIVATPEQSDDDHNEYDVQETPPQSPVELEDQLPPYFPAIQGCRSVEEFHCLNRIEEGTYGVVYRARDKKTDEIVALKRLKMEKEKEGFPITSLREINTLLKAQHPNIVTVREIVVGSNMDKIYIVMDYVEHDLKALMETMKQPFLVGEVKTLMIQLVRAVQHLHDNWILHRDLKTSNLLLSHKGILKVGDFGLAREYGSPLKHYTPVVVTLWYRAPELLLGTKEYSTPVDLWSVGCIFAEFLTMKPLFPGQSEIDELNRIFKDLGTPSEKIWPGVTELSGWKKCTFTEYPYNTLRNRFGPYLTDAGFEMLNRFLTYNPKKRITSEEALKHEYFTEAPLPVDPSMFPTWPAKSEMSSTRKHISSPKPPSGGKAYAKLLGDDDVFGGFHMSNAARQGVSASGPGFSLKF
ncbi:cyclin-dependent kinase 11B-like isoform X2 [Tubulanus polymorphus]|uniref:cyclin-dependent kinase 11B-like isoform X2 n=1 Tax=Tubulanus polymorphus TaxID=672921 RepID=UPI003DA223CF